MNITTLPAAHIGAACFDMHDGVPANFDPNGYADINYLRVGRAIVTRTLEHALTAESDIVNKVAYLVDVTFFPDSGDTLYTFGYYYDDAAYLMTILAQ